MVHAGKKPLGLKLVAVFIAKEKKLRRKESCLERFKM